VLLARLKPGDYFGEISMLTGTPRTADVIAETACKTLELTKKKFFAHSERFAGLPLLMLEVMASRLQLTSSRVVDSTFLDVPSRLLKYLYSISSIVEIDGRERRLVRECPSHQELAACVGSSREVITRTFKQLEKDGCILRKDKQVLLRDLVWRA
jgi:CRP/FNR family cyclic AMP-dependent transcriptional regulator